MKTKLFQTNVKYVHLPHFKYGSELQVLLYDLTANNSLEEKKKDIMKKNMINDLTF